MIPEWLFVTKILTFWIALMMAGGTAIALAWKSVDRFFWWSMLIGGVAMVISVRAPAHIQYSASKSINGEVIWSIDSKWFFLVALLLATFSILFAVTRGMKSANALKALKAENLFQQP